MALRRTVRPADLHSLVLNQQQDHFAEVISACGSLLEDAIREAWRHFYDDGPPGEGERILSRIEQEFPFDVDEHLNKAKIYRLYKALRKHGFFEEFRLYLDIETCAAVVHNDVDQLIQIRNKVVHDRASSLHHSDPDARLLTRKRSRDLAKHALSALAAVGQLSDRQVTSWRRQFSDRPTNPSACNLPTPWAPQVIGRQRLIDEFVDRLRDPQAHRFALQGLSGVGKSTLALAVAAQAYAEGAVTQAIWLSGKSRYYLPDGTLESRDLSGAPLEHCLRTIMQAFDMDVPGDADPLSEAKALLESCQRPLVVADNWESLQSDAGLQAFLLDLGPNVRVVYTSRTGVTEARPTTIEGLNLADSRTLLGLYLRETPHWNSLVNHPAQMRQVFDVTEGNPLLLTLVAGIALRSGQGLEEDVKKQLFRKRRGRTLLEFMHDYNVESLSEQARKAFFVLPLIGSTVRPELLAYALDTDYPNAKQILDELSEASLVSPVNRTTLGADGPGLLYRAHHFALEFSRRKAALSPSDISISMGRISRYRRSFEEGRQRMADEGYAPLVAPAERDALAAVISRMGRFLSMAASPDTIAAVKQLDADIPGEHAESAWVAAYRRDVWPRFGLESSTQSSPEAALESTRGPYSERAIALLVGQAKANRDIKPVLRLLQDRQTGDAIDRVSLHKFAVELGRSGYHQESEELYAAALEAMGEEASMAEHRQRQYFLIGRAENLRLWALKVRPSNYRRSAELLDRGQELLQHAKTLPFAQDARIEDKLQLIESS